VLLLKKRRRRLLWNETKRKSKAQDYHLSIKSKTTLMNAPLAWRFIPTCLWDNPRASFPPRPAVITVKQQQQKKESKGGKLLRPVFDIEMDDMLHDTPRTAGRDG
jgi:hypothetical protein